MKKLFWITLFLIIAVATLRAVASTPEQRDQSAKAAMEEARKTYNVKSDEDKYDDAIQEEHDDDRAAQQGEY